ncbi:MAG: hypothetical protein ABJO02_00340, partial [Reichenbachiella sp.]
MDINTLIKNNSNLIVVLIIMQLISGCDLELQEDFDYVGNPIEIPTSDLTVYEYVKSNPDSIFDHLSLAIEYTGMKSHFESSERTYFLLPDYTWEGSGGIIAALGGTTVEDIPVDKLKKLLLYHTIDEWVDQETLPTISTEYFYQTMLEGDHGIMVIEREEIRFRLDINDSRSVPDGTLSTRVDRHNYRFSNGVAHLLRNFLRYGEK